MGSGGSGGEGPPGVHLAIGVAGFALLVAGIVVVALRGGPLGYVLAVIGVMVTFGAAVAFLVRLLDRWWRP